MTDAERVRFDKLQTESQREAFLLCRSFAALKTEFPLSQSSLADRLGVTQQGAGYVIEKIELILADTIRPLLAKFTHVIVETISSGGQYRRN